METNNSKNKSGKIVLLIFLLICSGLGIAAFVMSLKVCEKDGFKKAGENSQEEYPHLTGYNKYGFLNNSNPDDDNYISLTPTGIDADNAKNKPSQPPCYISYKKDCSDRKQLNPEDCKKLMPQPYPGPSPSPGPSPDSKPCIESTEQCDPNNDTCCLLLTCDKYGGKYEYTCGWEI